MHAKKCKNSRRHIVKHDSSALGKSLQLPYGRRLKDIEGSKKYKTRKKSFPSQGNSDQSDELSRNFVDDYELRILYGDSTGDPGGGGDADQGDQNSEADRQGRSKCLRCQMCDYCPDCDRDSRGPSARGRPQPPDAAKCRDECRPKRRASLRIVRHDSSSESSGLRSRIPTSVSLTGDEITY